MVRFCRAMRACVARGETPLVNIDSSIALDLLSIVFMLVTMGGLKASRTRKTSGRLYFGLVVFVMAFLLLDMLYLVFSESSEGLSRDVAFAAKSAYFAVNAAIVWIWARYVDCTLFGRGGNRAFRAFYTCVLVINEGIVLVNLASKDMFFIGQDGSFVVGFALMWAFTLLNYLSALAVVAVLFSQRKRVKRGIIVPFALFPLVPFAAEVVQLFDRSVSLACAYAVSALMIYQVSQSDLMYTDELTGLATRRALADRLDKWFSGARHATLRGVMIDLDDLKRINDTFGHACGDEALKTLSAIIRASEPKEAVSARYGGDEFIIAWNAGDGPMASEVIARLEAGKAKANEHPAPWGSIDFSVGAIECAAFDCDGADSFLRQLDESMYEEKRRKKTGMETRDGA